MNWIDSSLFFSATSILFPTIYSQLACDQQSQHYLVEWNSMHCKQA